MNTIDTTILDGLIVGRIDPHIYAFTTNTVPNYLKVGDTYRPVNVRLNEWREHFPNLQHESNWEWTAKTKDGKDLDATSRCLLRRLIARRQLSA